MDSAARMSWDQEQIDKSQKLILKQFRVVSEKKCINHLFNIKHFGLSQINLLFFFQKSHKKLHTKFNKITLASSGPSPPVCMGFMGSRNNNQVNDDNHIRAHDNDSPTPATGQSIEDAFADQIIAKRDRRQSGQFNEKFLVQIRFFSELAPVYSITFNT